MQRVDTVGEIDVVAAETALGENDRDFGSKFGFAEVGGINHHARQARR